MKKINLTLAGFCISLCGFAQLGQGTGVSGISTPTTGTINQPTETGFLTNRPISQMNVHDLTGSPYLSAEYKPGFVKIKNGYSQDNVPIRFNIYKNTLEFRHNGLELALVDLDFAVYLDIAGDSSSKKMFRTGYPSVDRQNENSIYQVLASGEKAHLLKYLSQKVEDVKSMGDYDKKELNTYSTLYIYIPGQTINKTKADRKSIAGLFPGKEDKIDQLIKDRGLNLKKEKDLAELIESINNL